MPDGYQAVRYSAMEDSGVCCSAAVYRVLYFMMCCVLCDVSSAILCALQLSILITSLLLDFLIFQPVNI